ncbi:MAG: helix-turn-helix transcriptional regulator [Candidatus Levybacteria bacterium]|nr:helix-turn-helix transcriptional regulator [Candidatus Levybacteria bacterium]
MGSQEKKLGLQLKEARENKKLTQADVALQSDMTVTYYAMIERGEVNPSLEKVNKILDVLDLKLSIKEK